jgi:DNA-binding GntR family transcriptional regulator
MRQENKVLSEGVETVVDDKQAEVVKALEEDIIFGLLSPGTRLVEDTLMERFGATRHLIRQALYDLEREGIVSRERNKGAAVRSLPVSEVRQIYQVREMLQRQAALLIPLPASPELMAELETVHEAYRHHVQSGNMRGVYEANDLFHLTIFGASGNPYLVGSIKDYMGLSLPVRARGMTDEAMLNLSCQQHGVMLKLLRGTDSWALAQLCVDHIQPSKSEYIATVD